MANCQWSYSAYVCDCGAIANTVGSGYNTSCACANGLIWVNQTCVANCSGSLETATENPLICGCRSGSFWNSTISRCQSGCFQDGSSNTSYIWNSSANLCYLDCNSIPHTTSNANSSACVC